MRALPALLLATLLLPVADAQLREAVPGRAVALVEDIQVALRLETVHADMAPLMEPWFLAGHDSLLNFTIYNHGSKHWNGTLRVNVTGATSPNETLEFSIPPRTPQSRLITVHPEDIGMVSVKVESIDAFYAGGEAITQILTGPALLLPSARFVDPPVTGMGEEDEEFQRYSMFGGAQSPYAAYLRIPPGESMTPRIEVRNDLAVTTPAFRLSLQGSRSVGPVEVRALEPGQSVTVELPEFEPAGDYPGGSYFGAVTRLELRAFAEVGIGGASRSVQLASFRVERGAVTDVVPVTANVDVMEGLAVDILVPRDPQLGAPTRVRINVSNEGREAVRGTLTVTLTTPGGHFYEVQGPEVRSIPLDLASGDRDSETIEFVPRVTGQWGVNTVFRSGEGFGYGGSGGFKIEGPVRIVIDQPGGVEYARIGEPVQMDVSIVTTQTLQDAALRVTTGVGYRSFDPSAGGGAYRPGLSHRLMEVETSTASLGTLRPGGTVNASIEVMGRSSGRYDVVPYVLAEGFAYTSEPYDPARDGPIMGPYYGQSGFLVAVQPRALPPALALAPLTLGLAVFVGMWTFRTRFVR